MWSFKFCLSLKALEQIAQMCVLCARWINSRCLIKFVFLLAIRIPHEGIGQRNFLSFKKWGPRFFSFSKARSVSECSGFSVASLLGASIFLVNSDNTAGNSDVSPVHLQAFAIAL